MATLIQMRRGSENQWKTANPVLMEGEPGFEKETGIFKVGDGQTEYNSLQSVFAVGKIETILLDKDRWTGDTAPYTQRVDVDIMRKIFNPNVGLNPSSSYDVALVEVQEYSKLYKGDSEDGYMIFYATERPKCNLSLTIKRF